jgi:lysozyme
MRCNDQGLAIIKRFEGLRLKAYRCPANILSVGYGHTGSDVTEDLTITAEEADRLLRQDVGSAERAVEQFVTVPLNENQFSALVSFVYNVGSGNFHTSSLLKLLNAGKYEDAAACLVDWDKVHGKVLDGLLDRRIAETALFTTPAQSTDPAA